jgi:uncharacterized protein (DUF952 family)
MTRLIFKILRPAEWQEAQATTAYPGSAIDRKDGYIHFSTADQAAETAAKHFTDTDTVHVLAFKLADFPDALLKWEPSRGGALFPHLYAPLDVARACHQETLTRDKDGRHDFSFLEDLSPND